MTLVSATNGPLAIFVEMTQRAVAHGIGMPLAGPDAFLGNVRWRQFRGNHLVRIEALDRAVNDPLGTKIFGTIDAERKFSEFAVVDHLLGQEVFRAKAE